MMSLSRRCFKCSPLNLPHLPLTPAVALSSALLQHFIGTFSVIFSFILAWGWACVVPPGKWEVPSLTSNRRLLIPVVCCHRLYRGEQSRPAGVTLRHLGSDHVLRRQFPVWGTMKESSGVLGERLTGWMYFRWREGVRKCSPRKRHCRRHPRAE